MRIFECVAPLKKKKQKGLDNLIIFNRGMENMQSQQITETTVYSMDIVNMINHPFM